MKLNITTRQVASMAIFAAIYTALRIVPTVPMIGVPGAYFSLADILAPLYGIILGPYVGGASVLIGTFAAMSVKPPYFLGLDFLPGLVNAVAVGFLVRRKWLPVVALNTVLLLAFILNPLTSLFINVPIGGTNIALPFIWLHAAAFIILLSPLGRKASQWIEAAKPKMTVVSLAIYAFIGTMMQHLMGNILYENITVYVTHYMTPESLALDWYRVFFLYPIERTILVVFAVLVGVPLVRIVRKQFFLTKKSTTTDCQNKDNVSSTI